MFQFKGRIRKTKWNSLVLVIYSKTLSDRVAELNGQVALERFGDGLLLKPKGDLRATVVVNKRIQISATRMLRSFSSSQINVYVDKQMWRIKEIFLKGTDPVGIIDALPENILIKRAAIVRTRNRYNLDFSFMALAKKLSKKSLKCRIDRCQNTFLINPCHSEKGRRLYAHSGKRLRISLPRAALSEQELDVLSTRGRLPVFVGFDPMDLKISQIDSYTVSEEKELAASLMSKGIRIGLKDIRERGDIILTDYPAAIEIHNSLPNEFSSSKHSIKAGQVRLRLLEGYYLVKSERFDSYFVVINRNWMKINHIGELVSELRNARVFTILTGFDNGWSNGASDEILNILGTSALKNRCLQCK
ncbi:MAG: hypothetical protein NTY90_02405 [Candidatus Micrarchaeota archaeon]|nr:hypothetical protein [Candidatus Micrarchaeota archaeon]